MFWISFQSLKSQWTDHWECRVTEIFWEAGTLGLQILSLSTASGGLCLCYGAKSQISYDNTYTYIYIHSLTIYEYVHMAAFYALVHTLPNMLNMHSAKWNRTVQNKVVPWDCPFNGFGRVFFFFLKSWIWICFVYYMQVVQNKNIF